MQEEIDRRTLVDRPKILKDIQEARAQGDLSENFEYYAARKANRENNSRINYLQRMIDTAVIIEDRMDDDQVGINRRVTLKMPGRDEPMVLKVVTSVRADSMEGRITPESPIGRALMGHRAGDVCHVNVNGGMQYDVEILKVENPGEEATDRLRSY